MKKVAFILACALCAAGCSSSSKKEVTGCTDPQALNYNPDATMSSGDCTYPLTLTQEMVDAVTTPHKLDVTGPHIVGSFTIEDEEIGHGTIRDIFTSAPITGNEVAPGTVIVRKVYKKNNDGTRGDMMEITIMHKQPKGYFTHGRDIEYILIEGGESISPQHPNGVIPALNTENRGKVAECVTCHGHSATGGDGMFTR